MEADVGGRRASWRRVEAVEDDGVAARRLGGFEVRVDVVEGRAEL